MEITQIRYSFQKEEQTLLSLQTLSNPFGRPSFQGFSRLYRKGGDMDPTGSTILLWTQHGDGGTLQVTIPVLAMCASPEGVDNK